jgi:hypothetical protein
MYKFCTCKYTTDFLKHPLHMSKKNVQIQQQTFSLCKDTIIHDHATKASIPVL